jgi:hypothetical protein
MASSPFVFSEAMTEDAIVAAVSQEILPQPANVGSPPSTIHQQLHVAAHDNGLTTQALPKSTQLPGAWFYEMGSDEGIGSGTDSGLASSGLSGGCSPIADFTDDFHMGDLSMPFNPRNATESVEVPSSEHVAEIVGRQGCKIKALRAKTNTYIKTPVRGEEPVFVVTGRLEDVIEAKREIECAAEHFTQIRASRRHSQGGIPAPGHVTAYVRVPLRVVGLVVGPKGATIKRIQQDTHTYIITPSREREPIFEVTGLPQNVEAARREIEQHIYQRTGNMPITDPNAPISTYDLQKAALAAAISASQASTGSRPNYGALAAANQQSLRRGSYLDEAMRLAEYQRSGLLSHDAKAYGALVRNMNTATAMSSAFAGGVYGSASGSPRPGSPASSASTGTFLSGNNGFHQRASPTEASTASVDMGAYSAYYNEFGFPSDNKLSLLSVLRGHNDNTYQPWSTANVIGKDKQNTENSLPESAFTPNGGNSLFSGLNGNCGFAAADSLFSGDEGLGDSPTNSLISSFDRLNTFGAYNPKISSIWSDLDMKTYGCF